MAIREKTLGEVRYFTYYLIFPKGNDYWVKQVPFVNELTYELKKTKFPDEVKVKLQKYGEGSWKDFNGVTHRIVIDNEPIKKEIWGVRNR